MSRSFVFSSCDTNLNLAISTAMGGTTVAILPTNFRAESQLDRDVDIDLNTSPNKPLLPTKSRWSKPAIIFFVFIAMGVLTLTTEMQVIPRWASFDPRCSPNTLDVTTINYRSDHRFYSMLKDMKAFSPPTFRGKHEKLCTNENADKRKFEYCLPITSQDDPVFCTGADRIDLLVRQSPLTLCRASVMHLLLSDVYEELKAVGASPSVNFIAVDGNTQDDLISSGAILSTSIPYSGNITKGGSLDMALQQKGYHLFEETGGWRACVAPTHPLSSYLYDPDRKISSSGNSILHVDFIVAESETTTSSALNSFESVADVGDTCSPDTVNAMNIEYNSNNRFYSLLQSMEALPAPVFRGDHKELCNDLDRRDRGYRYCLPISGRKASSFCAGADRMELLAHPTRSTRCYACILHMLLSDVYDELQATGSDPILTFGTLLGAIRNGSMIPFTEDVDIAYSGTITNNGALDDALWKKGYHLFDYGIWRVCVAPTHPLASILYDPDEPIAQDYKVPYVDLYNMQKQNVGTYWKMQESKDLIPSDHVEPFSQVSINGLPFNTLNNPHYFLEKEYGKDYLKPKPRIHQDAFPEDNTSLRA